MSRYIPSSKKRPCPICENDTGKCREIEGEPIVLCMSLTSAANVPGYKFLKVDNKQGIWGIWAPANIERDEDEWRDELKRRRQSEAKAAERRRQRSMPVKERDQWYRTLLAELQLHPADRADLQKRGFTDKQIELIGFKSVEEWQSLDQQYPSNLPGVTRGGWRLGNQAEGYLCPAYNDQGMIAGLQIRQRHGDGGRYRWLSTKHSPVTLANDENPLLITGEKHPSLLNPVYLVEGIGAKPHLAAEMLGGTVIGAAGGQWASSPRQLEALLKRYAIGAEVILVPDAGDVVNEAVVRRDRKLISLLQSMGYVVTVLWWEQRLKGDLDIDELRPAPSNYITAEEFLAKCDWESRIRPARESQEQLNHRTIKPTQEYHERWLPELELPKPGSFLFVDSPMGSGKTEQLKKLIRKYWNRNNPILRSFGYRNSLLRQLVSKLNAAMPWLEADLIHDLEGHNRAGTAALINTSHAVLMCIDSLLRCEVSSMTGAFLFLDEVDAILKHLILGNTCRDHRERIMLRLAEIVQHVIATGGVVVAMEANLTDLTINTLRRLAPDAPFELVVNHGKPQPWNVVVSDGETSGLHERILASVRDGQTVAVATDVQQFAEELEDLFSRMQPDKKVLRVDGKTSETEAIRDFLTSPNEVLLAEKPSVLVYTPSAESGLDVTVDYFDQMYFYVSNLETRAQMQLLGRIRAPIPRFGLVGKAKFNDAEARSLRPDVLERDMLKNTTRALSLTKLAIEIVKQDPDNQTTWLEQLNAMATPQEGTPARVWLWAWCQYKARENGARADMRQNLIRALRLSGHQVSESRYGRSTWVTAIRKDIREIAADDEAEALGNARSDLPLDIAYKILRSNGSTEKKRLEARKAILQDRLPGVGLTKDFIRHAVVDNKGLFLRRTTLLWYVRNLDKAKALDRRRFVGYMANPFVYLPDFKSNTLQAELLLRSGILELLDDTERLEKDGDEQLVKFRKWCYWNRFEIRRVLGLTITDKTTALECWAKFARKLGYEIDSRKCGPRGAQVRIWSITDLGCEDRAAILQALDQKHSTCESAQLVSTTPLLSNSYPATATAQSPFKTGARVRIKGSGTLGTVEQAGTAIVFVKTDGGLVWSKTFDEVEAA